MIIAKGVSQSRLPSVLTVRGNSVLAVCKSSVGNASADYNLLVPNGTYVLTADDCIQCSCSASNYEQ